jgi:hypothetical protein
MVRAWEALPAQLRTNVGHLETTSKFRTDYPDRFDDFLDELNDLSVNPDIASKEIFLNSVKEFEAVTLIENSGDLFQALRNARNVNRVSDLESKGVSHFFRGTNLDSGGNLYPGNPNTIANGTSTSTDPIVATIFGIEAKTEFGGSGILTIARSESIGSVNLKPPNFRVELEREVIMDLTPSDFYQAKDIEITVDQARALIRQIKGYELDSSISSAFSRQALEDAPRMDPSEITQFYNLAEQLSN